MHSGKLTKEPVIRQDKTESDEQNSVFKFLKEKSANLIPNHVVDLWLSEISVGFSFYVIFCV